MERTRVSDELILETWRECGDNYALTARTLGIGKNVVRKRIMRKLRLKSRPYRHLRIPGAELYRLWLEAGGNRFSAREVAFSIGYEVETVRAAIKRHIRSLEIEE